MAHLNATAALNSFLDRVHHNRFDTPTRFNFVLHLVIDTILYVIEICR